MNDLQVGALKGLALVLILVAVMWSVGMGLMHRRDTLAADDGKVVPGQDAPEVGAEGAAPKMAVRMVPLAADGGPFDGVGFEGVGLWRLDVDGQTFLMVVTRMGVGLARYEPAAPAEGGDQ